MWQRTEPEARYRIALDLGDPALHEALAEAIEAHPALVAAAPGEAADLVIGDGGARRRPGAGCCASTRAPLPEQAPPELVLSAAHVMAAGLALERGAGGGAGGAPRAHAAGAGGAGADGRRRAEQG